jgi:nicotinamide-nucleotide amidase
VAVGTELLLGQIPNTNAQHISRALGSAGVDVLFHVAVGDNLQRANETIGTALGRSDVVIITGGLGPTPDDLTREAVAAALEVDLVRDPQLAETVRGIFHRLGRDMPEDNLRQADLPRGATAIQPEGTAPGFMLEHDDKVLFAVPGVPWEMRAMLDKTVLPELRRRAGGATIVSREVLVVGLGESHTHARIKDLVAAQTNPTIAFLASAGRVRVRVTAKAESDARALGLIEPVEREIRSRLGRAAVPGEGSSLAQILGDLLRGRGDKVAAAESLTGGMIAAELTETEGASEFFAGGAVAYTAAAKRDVLGVPQAVIDGPGVVSEECAAALAEGAARIFDAALALGTTGVAGPESHDGKPPGTAFVGAHYRGRTEVRSPRAYGDRASVRAITVTAALDLGRRLLEDS